ncbi:MAG TPA: sigma 54-interacting transcriptional regulator [Myxococcales bacterium]|nr:sigma 54-interacting transcriptional regulator [Myxococcales bacterium]
MKRSTTKATHAAPLPSRERRVPLHVPAVVRPSLPGCWTVNLSRSGIGLAASAAGPVPAPSEGDEIEVQFPLPDAEPVSARGLVCWRSDSIADGHGGISLGVRFVAYAGDGQLRVTRYIHQHRQRAAIAFCPAAERHLLREALEPEIDLHFCDSTNDVMGTLARGDVAALAICGHDADRAAALAELVATRGDAGQLLGPGQPGDLAPRVVYCAPSPPARLVKLFNEGRIFRALEPPLPPRALREVVAAACSEHGVRTEQQRAGFALERALLRSTHPAVRTPASAAPLVGWESPAARHALQLARIAAPHPVAVLLQGETGVGKEVLARMLHALGGEKRAGPFVAQDCGALSDTLLESELFGHVRGAFTGAVTDHPGLFVLADEGTIFLDEIENTSARFQSRLLRAVETGQVRPVGGTETRSVRVRLVAASNRDLAEEVKAGRFRADLYYRLNSFIIEIPPLRARRADVLPLARHFLAHFNRATGRAVAGISEEAEALLVACDWPGNVRELRNAIERAVLLTEAGAAIAPAALPRTLQGAGGRRTAGTLRDRLERVEREILREALDQAGGVIRRAARDLGADPVTLARRARKLGLLARPSAALPAAGDPPGPRT